MYFNPTDDSMVKICNAPSWHLLKNFAPITPDTYQDQKIDSTNNF